MRWLLELAIFALVAGPAAAQVNEAEKLFQSMENKLRTAKTLRCRFDSTLAGADQKVSLKGTLILGEGDKLRLEFDGKHDGDAVKVTLVSDGTNLSTRDSSERKKDKTEKAPKALGANARGTLSRMGVAIFWNGLIRGSNLRPDVLTVSGFKLGNKEKIGARNTQVIEYTVTEKKDVISPGNWRVKMWLDAETNLPVKLVVTTKDADITATAETYAEFNIDGKVDEKSFELPK